MKKNKLPAIVQAAITFYQINPQYVWNEYLEDKKEHHYVIGMKNSPTKWRIVLVIIKDSQPLEESDIALYEFEDPYKDPWGGVRWSVYTCPSRIKEQRKGKDILKILN